MILSSANQLCYAQEPVKRFEVKTPQTQMSSTFVPKLTNSLPSRAVETNPDKARSERGWFWRIVEGVAIGAAKYNTEKQSDGRPQPAGNFR
jgi:hypothetical protein